MIKPKSLAFVSFNLLRIVSVVCFLLVSGATIESMVEDGHNISAAEPEDWDECEYIPGTDVPTHAWGIFWVHLNRTFILVLCLFGLFSGEYMRQKRGTRLQEQSNMADQSTT